MNKIFLIFATIFLDIIIFIFGMWIGTIFQNPFQPDSVGCYCDCSQVTKKITSDMVAAILVNGQVKSIDNDTLTITNGSEDVSFAVNENTEVVSTAPDMPIVNTITRPPSKTFADIKVGDNLSIKTKILSNGEFEAESITILLSSNEQ